MQHRARVPALPAPGGCDHRALGATIFSSVNRADVHRLALALALLKVGLRGARGDGGGAGKAWWGQSREGVARRTGSSWPASQGSWEAGK